MRKEATLENPYEKLPFIVLLDCYSTHICAEFVNWFKSRYDGRQHPRGFLLYVPAGTTGLCQPADLTMQSKTKTILREAGSAHIAESLMKGLNLDLRLSFLKPKLLEWVAQVTAFWQVIAIVSKVFSSSQSDDGADLIRKGFKGFEKCYDELYQKKSMERSEELFPSHHDQPEGVARMEDSEEASESEESDSEPEDSGSEDAASDLPSPSEPAAPPAPPAEPPSPPLPPVDISTLSAKERERLEDLELEIQTNPVKFL